MESGLSVLLTMIPPFVIREVSSLLMARISSQAGPGSSLLVLRLFGPFDARINGASLPPLHSRKERWLLALLALHSPHPVDRSWLAGALWPDSTNEQSLLYLRIALMHLRRALGPEARRLSSPAPRALVLDLDGTEVDLLAFDEAIGRGDVGSLERAVCLYQGSLLADCDEPWILPDRTAREAACVEALEALSQAAIDDNDPHRAARCAERAVALAPMRESAHRLLMIARAASGNPAEAIRVYRDLRERLISEMRTEPSPETRAACEAIRAAGRRQARIQSEGEGSTRLSRTGRLPRPLSSLLGREREVAAVRDRLGTARLVTLVGPGGVGKTRLAIEVAGGLRDSFADGIRFVDLAPVVAPAYLLSAFAAALAIHEAPGGKPDETLLDALERQSMLLVIDNCEHVVEACARWVRRLLEECPGVRVLATSRAALRLRGEAEVVVAPLEVPGEREGDDPARLTESAAVALFRERAREAGVEIEPAGEALRMVAAICRRVDGLPLAIELAAARAKVLPPAALLARLERRLEVLTRGPRDLEERHRTLRDTLAWSYDLLSEEERWLFRRLSVFRGGFGLEAVEAMGKGDPEIDPLAAVESLVEKSLLIRRAGAEEAPRFGMLETIREYGLERLSEREEEGEARDRHLRFYREWAELAERMCRGSEQPEWLDRLEMEHDNLRTALERSRKANDSASFARLASALGHFWEVRGHFREGLEWLEGALASGPVEPRLRARVLEAAASLEAFGGMDSLSESGTARLEEAAERYREAGDEAAANRSLSLAFAWDPGRRPASPGEWLEQAREGTDGFTRALLMWRLRGQLEGAAGARLSDEALALSREVGNPGLTALTACERGQKHLYDGEHEQSRLLLEEALALARSLKYKRLIVRCQSWLAEMNEPEESGVARIVRLQESVDLIRETGDLRNLASRLSDLARALVIAGDTNRAAAVLKEAAALAEQARDGLPGQDRGRWG